MNLKKIFGFRNEREKENEKWAKITYPEFEKLWNALVPKSGPANTVQGELVRSIGNMLDELLVNGYCNWGKKYEIFCVFIETTLCDGTFDPKVNTQIIGDLNLIKAWANGENLKGNVETAHQKLEDLVVQWCKKHPSPISYNPI